MLPPRVGSGRAVTGTQGERGEGLAPGRDPPGAPRPPARAAPAEPHSPQTRRQDGRAARKGRAPTRHRGSPADSSRERRAASPPRPSAANAPAPDRRRWRSRGGAGRGSGGAVGAVGAVVAAGWRRRAAWRGCELGSFPRASRSPAGQSPVFHRTT